MSVEFQALADAPAFYRVTLSNLGGQCFLRAERVGELHIFTAPWLGDCSRIDLAAKAVETVFHANGLELLGELDREGDVIHVLAKPTNGWRLRHEAGS